MKNTFKYIAFGIALLASSFALNAQGTGTYHEEGGMKTSKKVTGPVDGYYTISLESFATGETTVTETATPVDIVLVLDVSGSMDYDLNTYSYNARSSQAYTYNNYSGTYYYLHTDGNYYAVSRGSYDTTTGNWPNQTTTRHYYLSYSVNGTTYYLFGDSVTTDRPSTPSGQSDGSWFNPSYGGGDTTIWTGVLYNRVTTSTESRLVALKKAVQTFVNTVNHNANYDSKENQRETPLTNQIAVVKYAMNQFVSNNGTVQNTSNNPANATGRDVLTPGNHISNSNYNPTEVLVSFTDVSTTAGVDAVMDGQGQSDGVNDLSAAGATASDFGMTKAWYLLNQNSIKNRESNKVVVLFTDGSPTHERNFDSNVANRTISWAKSIKDDFNATVFTIGVFDEETDDIRNYMNWTSSNYPNATGWNAAGSGGGDKGYYQNASGADLTEIFKAVASASAAADATAGASTQVRDVVSNSFILPSGDAAGITIKVADVKSDGSGWEDAVTATGVNYEVKTVTTSTGEEHQELMVTGFDYTKADTYNDSGFTVTAGNWVGERYTSSTDKYWAGKKLIIEFKVQANGEATGGDGSATNHPDSGVYVQDFNDDGSPKLDDDGNPVYHRVNQYDVPHTPLPILIKIQKDGLRTGESATFQLFRARPKGWNEDGETLEEKMANVEYNAIGKPLPDLHEFDPDAGNGKTYDPNDPMDYLEGIGWDDWSKVVLTNKGADNAAILKTLYGLDPGWVYMVVEDDWGWAYELTGESTRETTSDSELNPFKFHNKARTQNAAGDPIVKHAEAVTINHFQTLEGEGAREEHYKSSKTNFQSN